MFSGLALRDSTDQVGCLSKTDSSVHVPREFLFFKSSAASREREINPSVVVRISSSLTTLSCIIFFLFFFSFNFAHFNFRIKNIFHALAQSTTVVRQDVSHEYAIINNSSNNNNYKHPGSQAGQQTRTWSSLGDNLICSFPEVSTELSHHSPGQPNKDRKARNGCEIKLTPFRVTWLRPTRSSHSQCRFVRKRVKIK